MSFAVYRHFTADNTLLYVGFSSAPHSRTSTHSRKSDWFREVSKITIDWFETYEAAIAAEREAIKLEFPRENSRRNIGLSAEEIAGPKQWVRPLPRYKAQP